MPEPFVRGPYESLPARPRVPHPYHDLRQERLGIVRRSVRLERRRHPAHTQELAGHPTGREDEVDLAGRDQREREVVDSSVELQWLILQDTDLPMLGFQVLLTSKRLRRSPMNIPSVIEA